MAGGALPVLADERSSYSMYKHLLFLLFSQYGHPIEAEEWYYLIIKIVIYERHEAELLFVGKR